jgi:exodeoxyribonuclease V alpha subunit
LVIGDDNQLPSVGPGRVLNDLIESGRIPIVRLSKVHRQAARSQIVMNAQRVLEGLPPAFAPADSEGHPSDCHLLKPPSNLDKQARIDWVRNTLVDVVGRRLPARYPINPLRDIQVLSPMRKGELGVNELNRLLQQALNPQGPHTHEILIAGRLLRTGDRVLCNKNMRDLGISNGDVGRLASIDSENRVLVLDVGGKEIAIDFDKADKLSLAYAVTVHKSQGGEYPIVVALFFYQHFTMLRRNLLYTAMTRAKQRLVFLAAPEALEMAARTIDTTSRNTLLNQRIRMLAGRKAA